LWLIFMSILCKNDSKTCEQEKLFDQSHFFKII
jgi:hypothetical protein